MLESLEAACDEIIALTRTIDDLRVQCKFWRQAAEHAVTGWDKLEDEHELLLDTLRALVHDNTPELPATIAELKQSLPGFTIVETEKPR